MISIEGLSKRFGKTTVFQGLNFSVSAGEVVGLTGPNGSGKTTLLKILATLILPSEGIAALGGFDLTREDREIRNLIGWVSSDPRSFYSQITPLDNLLFFGRLMGLHPNKLKPRAESLLEEFSLSNLKEKPVELLSSGERQRLSLAQAFLNEPSILLLDEPLSHLDKAHQASCTLLLKKKMGQKKMAALWVSHRPEELQKVATRILRLDKGRFC